MQITVVVRHVSLMHADTDTANNVEEIMGKTLNNTFAVSIFGPFVGLEFRGGGWGVGHMFQLMFFNVLSTC